MLPFYLMAAALLVAGPVAGIGLVMMGARDRRVWMTEPRMVLASSIGGALVFGAVGLVAMVVPEGMPLGVPIGVSVGAVGGAVIGVLGVLVKRLFVRARVR